MIIRWRVLWRSNDPHTVLFFRLVGTLHDMPPFDDMGVDQSNEGKQVLSVDPSAAVLVASSIARLILRDHYGRRRQCNQETWNATAQHLMHIAVGVRGVGIQHRCHSFGEAERNELRRRAMHAAMELTEDRGRCGKSAVQFSDATSQPLRPDWCMRRQRASRCMAQVQLAE